MKCLYDVLTVTFIRDIQTKRCMVVTDDSGFVRTIEATYRYVEVHGYRKLEKKHRHGIGHFNETFLLIFVAYLSCVSNGNAGTKKKRTLRMMGRDSD